MTHWNRRIPRTTHSHPRQARRIRKPSLKGSSLDTSNHSDRYDGATAAEKGSKPVASAYQLSMLHDPPREEIQSANGSQTETSTELNGPANPAGLESPHCSPRVRVNTGRRRRKQRMTWEELEALDGLFVKDHGDQKRVKFEGKAPEPCPPSDIWCETASRDLRNNSGRPMSLGSIHPRPLIPSAPHEDAKQNLTVESGIQAARQSRFFSTQSHSGFGPLPAPSHTTKVVSSLALKSVTTSTSPEAAASTRLSSVKTEARGEKDVDIFLNMGHSKACWCSLGNCQSAVSSAEVEDEDEGWTVVLSAGHGPCRALP